MREKNQKGAITVIFLAVVALVLILILTATQSRLLLSLRRSQSSIDILLANYEAESEVNNIMAKLIGGYLKKSNIPKTTKVIGGVRIEIEGKDTGETQTVTATVLRGLAVGRVQGVRKLTSIETLDNVEIVLMLDCTGSMDATDADPNCTGSNCPTRFDALRTAAVNFVNDISKLPDRDNIKLAVGIFGTSSAWLQYQGRDITSNSGLSFNQIANAIQTGINRKRVGGQCERVLDYTSIGTAFRHAHDYLATTKKTDTKQVEIVITDGEPNSRLPDVFCPPSERCIPIESSYEECIPKAYNYLRCTLADQKTFVSEINQNGVRDPEVDAYAVTIFPTPPESVVQIFNKYATEGGYFNASRANELSGILNKILNKILTERANITIKRVIPLPQ